MSNDEKIYRKILKAIIEHQLEPGSRLPEDKLSEAFGVSRTGIRKVLQRLALEHFVMIQPNKGAQVSQPSEKEADEVLNSRIMLEPQLIPDLLTHWNPRHSVNFRNMLKFEQQAMLRGDLASSIQLTAKFHYELAKLSGNSVLADFVEQLCYRSSLIIAAYGSRSSVSCDCGDHIELIELLDSNANQQAQIWMKDHLQQIKSSISLTCTDEKQINFQQLFADKD